MTNNAVQRLAACAALILATLATNASAEPASKWRIQFDHYARDPGELVLRITPLNGTPIDVATQIADAKSENQAANLLRKSLKTALGKGYHVEVDDGEDVILKRKGKTPKFEVALVSNTVNGLSVTIK